MLKGTILWGLTLGVLLAAPQAMAQSSDQTATGRIGAVLNPRMTGVEKAWGFWTKRVGISEFPFLKIGQSARAEAMGGAFVAIADDISASYFNPAGLAHIEHAAYTLNYTRWLADSKIFSGALALNAGFGVIGINVVSFMAQKFEVTTPTAPTGSGVMAQVGDMAIGVQFAKRMTDKFMLGGQVRWVQQDLYLKKVSTVNYNLGTFFYTGYKSVRVAMSFRNLGPNVKATEGGFTSQMPTTYSLGVAMEVFGNKGDPSYATLSYESEFITDFQPVNRIGAEVWLQNLLALRAGYRTGFELEDWSLGMGLKHALLPGKEFFVDLSYHHNKTGLFNAPLRVSLGGTF